MCSDWSAGSVWRAWSIVSSMFQKCRAPYHNHEFQHTINATHPGPAPYALGGNDLTEGYFDVFFPERKLKTKIKAFQGVQKQCALM